MVTLQQILDMVSLKYPHSYTNAQVVSIINEIQKQLFRTIYKPQGTTSYDIVGGTAFYPIDFSPETIDEVVVDGEEYPFQNIKYDAQEFYYYILDGNSIGLYPTPSESIPGGLMVFHTKVPTTLSESNLSASPDFDAAWHQIIVLRVCRELATIARDSDMVNNFTSDVNEIELEYKRSKRGRPHQINNVYGGWI